MNSCQVAGQSREPSTTACTRIASPSARLDGPPQLPVSARANRHGQRLHAEAGAAVRRHVAKPRAVQVVLVLTGFDTLRAGAAARAAGPEVWPTLANFWSADLESKRPRTRGNARRCVVPALDRCAFVGRRSIQLSYRHVLSDRRPTWRIRAPGASAGRTLPRNSGFSLWTSCAAAGDRLDDRPSSLTRLSRERVEEVPRPRRSPH
jgi:hypothetical protein